MYKRSLVAPLHTITRLLIALFQVSWADVLMYHSLAGAVERGLLSVQSHFLIMSFMANMEEHSAVASAYSREMRKLPPCA